MQALGLARFVDVRSGEVKLFLRAFFVLLLTIAGHTVLETARDALFLSKLQPQLLTLVYVTTALVMVIVTPLSIRLTRGAGARNALVVSLLLTAFGAAWFRIRPPGSGTVFALYVFGALSATLLVGQFWLLAGALFSAAQSRRLFGPLASGGVLGAIGGAGLASLLLEVAPLPALLGAAALCYFAAALVATKMPVEEAPAAASPSTAATPLGLQLSKLRRDPFLARLSAIAALSVAVSVVVDYLFKVRVSSSLAPEQLGPFFARYQLVLSIGSLVMQVVITGPVVQRIGVVGLALTAPLLLTFGGTITAILAAPFWLVIVLKGTDTALRNSLGRVASELLWAPVEQQTRARSVVDLLITRSAQAVAGVVLLGATLGRDLPPGLLASAAATLAIIWLLVGVGIRRPYIAVFRNALSRGSVERDFTLAELDLTSVETLVEALARPQSPEVIAAMNVLAERKRERLVPALILLHSDEGVLLRALELFGGSPRSDWYPLGERLLDHVSPTLQQAALRAFAMAGAGAVLKRVAQHPSATLRTFAALYLAQLERKAFEGDPLSWELFAADDEGHTLKLAFIAAMAAHVTADAPRILLGFARLPALRGAVTLALEAAGDASSVDFLIGRLKWADDRLSARRGLKRLGAAALQALAKALADESLERRVRIHVPRSISTFASVGALALLLDALVNHKDGLVRYKALRGLEQLARETTLRIDSVPIFHELTRNCLEYLRLFSAKLSFESDRSIAGNLEAQLVTELLDDKIQQSRERLTRLLQVLHRGDDIRSIFLALASPDHRLRGRAVEFLDALIRGFHRSSDESAMLLRLVVDDLPAKERAERAVALVGAFPDARAALDMLSRDADKVVRELSLRALEGLGPIQPREPLEQLALLHEQPA